MIADLRIEIAGYLYVVSPKDIKIAVLVKKLDGVGPVDNRPSTD